MRPVGDAPHVVAREKRGEGGRPMDVLNRGIKR